MFWEVSFHKWQTRLVPNKYYKDDIIFWHVSIECQANKQTLNPTVCLTTELKQIIVLDLVHLPVSATHLFAKLLILLWNLSY
jgi:hypothetical protein